MKDKFITMLAAIAMLGSMLLSGVALASPANAGMFSEVHHAADDSGYTGPIDIECEDGRRFSLYVGQGSPSRCGAQTRYIHVRYNQTVRCTDMTRPWEGWLTYYTGRNYIDSYRTLKCYSQRPL